MLGKQDAYQQFIEKRLRLINKEGRDVPFLLNAIQKRYLLEQATGRDVILKARQQGFSSLILALFTVDFLTKPHSESVVVADVSDNAIALLDRVKHYLASYETHYQTKLNLKYNSKSELVNGNNGAKYKIGTAEHTEFGRSRTITNLHLSEFAFYAQPRRMLASALQAVVPTGYAVIETTANGFNEFKEFWDESKRGETNFAPLFYKASDFYDQVFLGNKKKELQALFKQEYPETDLEAFISSGEMFFNPDALREHLARAQKPVTEGVVYG